MRHPSLDAVIEVPDDDGCIAAHVESGWVESADDTVQHHPALMPGEKPPEPEPPATKTKPAPEGASR